MDTAAPISPATALTAEQQGSRRQASGLIFWLPLLAIAFAMVASNHHVWHAHEATGEKMNDAHLDNVVGGATAIRQVGFLLLGGVGLVLLFGVEAPKTKIENVKLLRWMLVCFFLLAGSALWSDSMMSTMKRAVIPGLMLAGAFGVAAHWNANDLCRCGLIISAAMMLAGFLIELKIGVFLGGDDYRFSGTLHPNRQAGNCAITAIAAACLFMQQRRWLWLMAFFVGVGFVLLTSSRGAAIALTATLTALVWLAASSQQRWMLSALFCVALVVGLIFVGGASQDFSTRIQEAVRMGRGGETAGEVSSLTGRIPIWIDICADIAKRPLLGYGYGAFWTPDRVHKYSYILDWEFDNAHSVYFELMLHVGFVGLFSVLATALNAIRSHWGAFRVSRQAGSMFLIGLCIMAGIHGLVEAIYVTPGLPLMLIMTGAAIAVYGLDQPSAATTREAGDG